MIKIEQLLPLLKKGWVAMDKDEYWWWFKTEPTVSVKNECWISDNTIWCLSNSFTIQPTKDWTKSLMRCGDE